WDKILPQKGFPAVRDKIPPQKVWDKNPIPKGVFLQSGIKSQPKKFGIKIPPQKDFPAVRSKNPTRKGFPAVRAKIPPQK
ncbi:hypothetical protein HGM15179_017496, partial [Zosterops borbonicus]